MHLTKKYMGVTAPIMLTPEGVSFKIKDFRVYVLLRRQRELT